MQSNSVAYAGLGRRAAAFVVDYGLISVCSYPVAVFLHQWLGNLGVEAETVDQAIYVTAGVLFLVLFLTTAVIFPTPPAGYSLAYVGGAILRFLGLIVGGILAFLAAAIAVGVGGDIPGIRENPEFVFALFIAELIAPWIYWAVMESSPAQATLGKMMMGIVVTELEGQRVSFLRATGRHFGRFISLIIVAWSYWGSFLGSSGWEEVTRLVHDHLAGTRVVMGNS